MMMHKKPLFFACLFTLIAWSAPTLHAEWVWSPELGKFVSPKDETRDNSSQQLDYALELYKQKQYDKAANELESLIKQYPASRIAPEAQYRLGTMYEEKGDYFKALKAHQKMIEVYPQNDRFEEVIEREFKLGNLFLSGKKGKLYGIEIRPAIPIAAQAFEHITKYAPYGAFGDQAQFNLAIAQKRSGQFETALESFQAVLDNYPQSPLVEQARYELAETAYFRSVSQNRDERALEKASEQVQGFIERYPGAPGTENAAKIRDEIDEKNAQKNYQIGLFYEKQNFVQSSLIYYQDVARRYPYTQWGVKAAERLRALKQPVEFLASERDKLDADYDDAKKRLAAWDASGDPSEKEALERKLERLEKRRKSLEKEKGEGVSRLAQDLTRREAELKQKFKNLDKKIKQHKDNPSEDFKKAMDRWRASLEVERDALEAEKQQLSGWRAELGLKPFYDGWIPFTGEPKTPLEKIQAVDAREFYKISEKTKKTLDEKEVLYKQHQEVAAIAGGFSSVASSARPPLSPENKALFASVEQQLNQYSARFGSDEWLVALSRRYGFSDPSAVNPFKGGAMTSKKPQELLELRMHLREKVGAAQNVVDTLSTAFNEDLELIEQERVAEKLESSEQVDPKELRKEIKKAEKGIRSRYEEIEERDKRKQKLLDDLNHLVGNKSKKTTSEKIAAPILFPVKVARVFLFGRDDAAQALTNKAGRSAKPDAQEIKKEIETESLMIQAQSREILSLEKQLETLHAQASLAGGLQFRSSMVKVPYVFIDDAINNAEKLITPEERQEMLVDKLAQKTKELEALRRELQEVEAAVAKLPQADQPTAMDADLASTLTASTGADRESMRHEIEKLAADLPLSSAATPQPGSVSNAALPASVDPKTLKELREIEQSLAEVINDQIELQNAEKKILERRMAEADSQLQKVTSKAMRGDLVKERERMDARITEVTQQLDFLEKEKIRFTSQKA